MEYTVFTYGTLMQGRINHRLMQGAKFLGEYRLKGYKMYDMGRYPGIVPAEEHHTVLGECYRIDGQMLIKLDQLEEEGSLYRRTSVTVSRDHVPLEVFTYVYLRSVAGLPSVDASEDLWKPR